MTRIEDTSGAVGTGSWLLVSHLESERGELDLLLHVVMGSPGNVQAAVSLRDPLTGSYLHEERDHARAGCAADPGRGAIRWTGTWSEIDVDLTVDCPERPMLHDTRARTTGTVSIGGERYLVSGPSWYDHA